VSLKALMVDVDGVLAISPEGCRWDADMEADLGVAPADLQMHLFAERFRECVLGRAALEDQLAEVLPLFAPAVSPECLMAYWFEKDSRLDQVLLDDLEQARAGGLPLYLATVQEHRRADYLWNALKLHERFDGCLHSARMGAAKPDPAYFDAAAKEVALSPVDLLLIDDSARNVEAALAAGWRAKLWVTGESRLGEVLARHGG
jgi:putative hydrolase of the HAD superfamily